jgi:RNA polymerase sigma-70 factor (ECF subfamily)
MPLLLDRPLEGPAAPGVLVGSLPPIAPPNSRTSPISPTSRTSPTDAASAVAAARAGDQGAFTALVERHRHELHVHCYRMLGSFDEAEDMVQETFLRAWRSLDRFSGGENFRAWLYRIATNACLDAHRKAKRQVRSLDSVVDVPWLQPYPDPLLDAVAAAVDDELDSIVVARETIELSFIAVLQLLPPRQRAVLIARDVLGWSANETADLLDMTVASANSALQRGRATLQDQLPDRRDDWTTTALSAEERELLDQFIDAHERQDVAASVRLLRDDTRITMPPAPFVFEGRELITGALTTAFGVESEGDWRLLPTAVNRLPAAGSYLRRHGETEFRAFKLDVLRIVDGGIAEITTFGYSLFPALGLPPTLPPS